MRNVLFIVYYFPPMGGSGVQRPLKFIKYLRDYGWNPIVVTPEPGAYHTFDRSLEEELISLDIEIHRVEAITPFHRTGQSSRTIDFIPEWLAKPLRWISTFFWLPDNKTGWIKPGFRKAMEIINNQDIDIIFSTAAPYSNLVMAEMLKKATDLPVVMDLRDDWLDSHLITYPTSLHRNKMAVIEKKTLSAADLITVINDHTKEAIQNRIGDVAIEKVNQGFDPADFEIEVKEPTEKKFRLLYSGLFYGERKPDLFLQCIQDLILEIPELADDLELHFQGGLDDRIINLIGEMDLEHFILNHGYIDHEKAVANLLSADILWLIVGHTHKANQVTVGKMFEYFGSEKPILGLVPEGNSKDLLLEYGASFVADPYQEDQIKEQLRSAYRMWKDDSLPKPNPNFVKEFDRKEISGHLARLFNKYAG